MLAFGRVFFYWIEANHLANETARWAIVDRNPYATGQTLQQHAAPELDRRVRERRPRLHLASRTAPRPASRLVGQVQKPFRFLPDPQRRHDHDPRLVDHADRELQRRGGQPRRPTRQGLPGKGLHVSRLRDEQRGGILVALRRSDPVVPPRDGSRRRRRQLVHAQAAAPEPRRCGAFAAGVEYAKNWQACVSSNPNPAEPLQTRSRDAARQYAGDPEASDYSTHHGPPALQNTEIAQTQSKPRRRHQLERRQLHRRHRQHRRRRRGRRGPVLQPPRPTHGPDLTGRRAVDGRQGQGTRPPVSLRRRRPPARPCRCASPGRDPPRAQRTPVPPARGAE